MYCSSTGYGCVVADYASGFVKGLTGALCLGRVGRGYRRGVMAGLLSVAGAVVLPGAFGVETSQAQTRQINWQSTDPARGTVCKRYGSADRSGGINNSPVYTFSDSNQNIEKCGIYANSPSRNYDGDGADVSGAFPRIAVIYGKRAADSRTQQPGLPIKVRIYRANSNRPSTSGVTVTCIVNGAERATITGAGPNTWKIALSDGESCNLKVRIDPRTNPDWPALELTATLKRETTGNHVTMSDTRFRGGRNVGGTIAVTAKTTTRFEPLPKDIGNAVVGRPVTVTATVTNDTGATTPTGTVTFKNGNRNIACTNTGDGTLRERRTGVAVATCTFTPGTSGPIVLDVEYAKTSNFEASKASEASGANPAQTPDERTLTVAKATARAAFVTGPQGQTTTTDAITPTAGNDIPLYVKVESTAQPAQSLDGEVELQDDSGAKIPNSSCGSLNNGVATCTIPGASVTPALTEVHAGYKGDTRHNDITSNQRPRRSIRVSSSKTGLAKPTIVLTPSNPQAGDKITATITFTKPQGQSANFNGVPKITISGIRIDNDMCASVTAVPANGVITCTFDVPVAGNGEVRVAYSGDPTYADTQAGPAPFTVISRTGKLPAPAPVISLDKTNPDINGEVTVTVTFASPPKQGTGYSGTVKVTVTGTGNPSAAIGKNTCGRDITIPTTGGPVTCRFTPTSIGEFEVSIAPADLNDKAYNFGAAKPVKGRAGPKVADLTAQMIRDFLGDRNAMLLASTPDIHMRLRDREQSGAGGHISVNLGKSEDGTASALSMELRTPLPGDVSITDDTITFAASARRLMGSGLFGADVSDDVADPIIYTDVSKSADPVQRWDVWVEGRIARFDSDNGKDGKFGVVYLGADYLITPNILIGLMTQYDWLSKDYRAANGQITGHVKGKGWMVGPYAAVRFGEKLYLDVQARGGQSSNDITPIGTYTDTFKTTRWFVRGKLIGDFDYGDWTIRPGVAVQYISEKQKAYTDSLGNAIAAQTVSQGDVRVGPRIAYTYNLAGGSALIPWAEFAGVYTFGSKGKFSNGTYASDIHGFSGSVKAGVDWWTPGGARFSLAGSYDGIGSGSASYGVQARVEITF